MHKRVHDYLQKNIGYIEPKDVVVENKKDLIHNFEMVESATEELFETMDKILKKRLLHNYCNCYGKSTIVRDGESS